MEKLNLFLAFVVVLSLVATLPAEEQIPEPEIIPRLDCNGETIEITGRVTITERSWIGGGCHLIINGGTLVVTAGRFDVDDATISVTGGGVVHFDCDLKIPDEKGPSIIEVLYGMMTVRNIDNLIGERGGHIVIAGDGIWGGIFRLANGDAGNPREDPNIWISEGLLYSIPEGYYWPAVRPWCNGFQVVLVPGGGPPCEDHDDDCWSHYHEIWGDNDDDGTMNIEDNCPEQDNPCQEDGDYDWVGDVCDNCPDDYNRDQTDTDGDGLGDACDCSCNGDVNQDGWLSPADVGELVGQLLPHASSYYWLQTNLDSCGDMVPDGWLSPGDVSALVGELLPHGSNNYWLQCP